jgi:hypothetical protein
MKKPKIIRIDTIAMLKHKDCDFELHLKNNGFYTSPLNLFQRFLYWCLRFEYVYGIDYFELMNKRFESKD